MTEILGPYRAAIAAVLGAVAVAFAAAITDDVVTGAEAVGMTLLALGTFMTYVLPNAPGYKHVKLLTNAAFVGFSLVAQWLAVDQEITTTMWVQLGVAVAVALGIIVVPNDQEPAVPSTAAVPASG